MRNYGSELVRIKVLHYLRYRKNLHIKEETKIFSPYVKKKLKYLIKIDKSYIEEGKLTNECTLYKNFTEYVKFKDVSDFKFKEDQVSITSFKRELKILIIYIKFDRIYSIQSYLNFKYIKNLRLSKNSEKFLLKKIVSYDIETFKDKNNIFLPYIITILIKILENILKYLKDLLNKNIEEEIDKYCLESNNSNDNSNDNKNNAFYEKDIFWLSLITIFHNV